MQSQVLPQSLPLLALLLLLGTAAESQKRTVRIRERLEHRDFVPLSAANLTEVALQDESAWVLYFDDGFLDPEVKRSAARVRGLVRFGLVSVADREATELLKFDPSRHFFRSLPFGWETRKRRKSLDTEGFTEALEHATASVPDDLLTVIRTEKDTKALLAEAIASKPSRFTVLFTVKGSEPSLLHRVLSRKLISNFNFALLPNADFPDALKSVGLGGLTLTVPGMSVLMVTQSGGVRSSRMAEAGGGGAEDFAQALRFLVEFNRQFRPELPGDNRSADRRVRYMSDVLDAERLVFDIRDAAKTGESVEEDFREEL